MTGSKTAASYLEWTHIPQLTRPVLIVAFYGWSDAGNVAGGTAEYIHDTLGAETVGSLDCESFLNFALDRPIARVEHGLLCEIESSRADLSCWKNPDGEHDVVLCIGKEPHFNWRLYSEIVVELMRTVDSRKVFTLGGVQDSISHLAAAKISVVASSPSLVLDSVALEPEIGAANYHGPMSIHSQLVQACIDNGFHAVSLWGHVPAYLQHCPRTMAKLVTSLNKAIGMSCPVDSLIRRSLEMDRTIEEAARSDPHLRQLVESIESTEPPLNSRKDDDNVIRLRDFLRREFPRDPQV